MSDRFRRLQPELILAMTYCQAQCHDINPLLLSGSCRLFGESETAVHKRSTVIASEVQHNGNFQGSGDINTAPVAQRRLLIGRDIGKRA